ncbi:MAG: RNA polymerase subunit sigma-24 [Flavobacteriales bacterium]|nr:MAG: RNA polymerase subunit sigma-24 [Flavobacteriales bacterium]
MQAQLISDKELVFRYCNGSEAALEVLISRHKERVFGYIMHLVHDRQYAEDIFQDTFIKVINTLKRGTYNEEGKFLPWVLTISHNLVVDGYRKNKRMPTVDGGEDFDIFDVIKRDDPNAEEELITNQIHSDVRNLIDLLPKEQKEVLIMRIYNRMAFKEISEETNVSINTALGRMRYALINLRKLMEEKNVTLTTY